MVCHTEIRVMQVVILSGTECIRANVEAAERAGCDGKFRDREIISVIPLPVCEPLRPDAATLQLSIINNNHSHVMTSSVFWISLLVIAFAYVLRYLYQLRQGMLAAERSGLSYVISPIYVHSQLWRTVAGPIIWLLGWLPNQWTRKFLP
jgi:hypothetical protein